MNNDSQLFNKELMLDKNLYIREHALEEDAHNVAIDRVRKKVEMQGLDKTQVGTDKVYEVLADVANNLALWCVEQGAKRRKPEAFKYISAIDPSVLAFVAAKQCVITLVKGDAPFVKVTLAIGRRIKELVDYDIFLTAQKAAYKDIEHRIKFAGTERKRLRVLNKKLSELGFEGADWSEQVCIAIGAQLLETFIDTTGYLQVINRREGRKTRKTIGITPLAEEWLATSEIKESLLAPFHYPMLVPPQPWTTPYDGGYLNKQLHPLNLVWSRNKLSNRILENQEMPEVYEAINALQDTPWRINKRVQEVFSTLLESKEAVAGLPAQTPRELPAKPWEPTLTQDEISTWIEVNEEAFANWKRKTSEIHVENGKAASKLSAATQKHTLSLKFLTEKAMYYPYGLDFRGRIYAAAGAGSINPQADDSGKALLEFAVGKPVGDAGGFWLGVHLANTFGEDKISLEERVRWAVEHTLEIELYAANPLDFRGWMDADKPFSFLAACFEWAGFMAEGDSFVSHLPIAVDGSCSGLQHFGAMLKDEETCKSVNVIGAGSTPTDVYTKVRDRVAALIAQDTNVLAEEWKTRLKRDTVKQPTMTTPYGVSVRGMKDQIKNAIIKMVDKGSIPPFSVSASEASVYLTPFVATAISEVVSAATLAMDWLSHVAEVCAEADRPVRWTTPTGLSVTQAYKKQVGKVTNLMYGGQRMQLHLKVDTPQINKAKSKAGCAPNFVHSMDASHLMATVAYSVHNNVDTFAMIHDSFGTHCASVETLSAVLRETFITQYNGNVLADLYAEVSQQLPAESLADLLPPPCQGEMELAQVRNSEFFFA